jgi:hypothetical protein
MNPIEILAARKSEQLRLNSEAGKRTALEAKYGTVYDTDQMREHFSVIGFGAPYLVVTRKSDGVKGSLEFQHAPRYYFNFEATE